MSSKLSRISLESTEMLSVESFLARDYTSGLDVFSSVMPNLISNFWSRSSWWILCGDELISFYANLTIVWFLGCFISLLQSAPKCELDQDAKLDLCMKYLQSLPRAQVECRTSDISILFDLLRGMRDVLETDLTVCIFSHAKFLSMQ